VVPPRLIGRTTDNGGKVAVSLERGIYEIVVTASGFRTKQTEVDMRTSALQAIAVILEISNIPVRGPCGSSERVVFEPEIPLQSTDITSEIDLKPMGSAPEALTSMHRKTKIRKL